MVLQKNSDDETLDSKKYDQEKSVCKNPLNKISNKEKLQSKNLTPKFKQWRILQKKINSKIFKSNGKILIITKIDEKKLTVESQRTYILTKKSKQHKCLAQKIYGEMSRSKNIQAGKSYGNGCEIKKLTENTDIKTLDDNNLNAKGKALKSLTILNITVFILKFHGK